MNREIIFRAKSGQTWYYGGVHRDKLYRGAIGCDDYVYRWHLVTDEGDEYRVSPKTICQYTGLTDRNGNKIFEGDIIQSYHHGEPMGVAVIYWQGSSFWCDLLSGSQFDCCDTLDEWDCECGLEIIGNIFDNKDIVDAREWSSDGEWLGES